jgi:plastocyanin
MFSLISTNKKKIKCLSITIIILIILIIILAVFLCLCLCKNKNDSIVIKEPLVKQKYNELFRSSVISESKRSSSDTITITQAGDFQWTMVSDVEGVVDSNKKYFPTLTIKQGTVVNFVGKVEKTHSFSVKSNESGKVVVGPSELADSAAGVAYKFTWTASNVGMFEYFCAPHESFMKGTIIVV